MAKLSLKSNLVNGVLRGIAAPLDVFEVNTYPYPHQTDRDAINLDVRRVGDTFKSVMSETNAETSD